MNKAVLLLGVLLSGCAAIDNAVDYYPPAAPWAQKPGAHPAPAKPDPVVLAGVLRLLDDGEKDPAVFAPPASPALDKVATMDTPAGFQLSTRYTHIGIPLAEALTTAGDPMVYDRIVEASRWTRNLEVRTAALLTLAKRHSLEDKPFFEEALVSSDAALHLSLLEALEEWHRPEGALMLERLLADLSPLVRVYAAQILLRKGDSRGREEILRELDGGDWLARAMAARYLGLFGSGGDYNLLLDRLTREQANDFVVAEIAIAALKLFPASQSQPRVPPAGALKPAAPTDSDLEPLVITAPRLKISATALIDGRINAALLRLLEQKADARPEGQDLSSPSMVTLNTAVSPELLKLRTRYSHLGFLLAEGLAGTTDLLLRDRILHVARSADNGAIRSAAMLAVAYDGDARDRTLFEQALASKDPAVRFGAVEAYGRWAQKSGLGTSTGLINLEVTDPLAAWAEHGRIPARTWIDDPDWVVRALAIRSADGGVDLVSRLASEQNVFVRAELCAALLRRSR